MTIVFVQKVWKADEFIKKMHWGHYSEWMLSQLTEAEDLLISAVRAPHWFFFLCRFKWMETLSPLQVTAVDLIS